MHRNRQGRNRVNNRKLSIDEETLETDAGPLFGQGSSESHRIEPLEHRENPVVQIVAVFLGNMPQRAARSFNTLVVRTTNLWLSRAVEFFLERLRSCLTSSSCCCELRAPTHCVCC